MTAASIAAELADKSIPASWTGALTVVESDELITRSRIGDREAFEALYRAYVQLVYRYVMTRVPRSVVEDTVAEVFVRALRNISRFEFRGIEFSAWLIRIARNLIVDQSKSAYVNREILHHTTPEVHGTLETETSALAALDAEQIRAGLSRMKPDHRTVLELRFIRGESTAAIAKAMNKTEGAVRVLQFRALSALKRELEKTAPDLLVREL